MAEKRGPSFGASWVASGDLSGAQFRLVTFTGKDVYLANSGNQCAGVLQNKPVDNAHAAVDADGFTKLHLGSSLGTGAEFMAGGSGFATLANSIPGQFVQGYLISAGDSGDIVEAHLNQYRR